MDIVSTCRIASGLYGSLQMMREPIVLGLVVLVWNSPAFAQLPTATPEAVGLSAKRLERATNRLQGHVDAGDITGVVGAVVRHGKLVYLESPWPSAPRGAAPDATKHALPVFAVCDDVRSQRVDRDDLPYAAKAARARRTWTRTISRRYWALPMRSSKGSHSSAAAAAAAAMVSVVGGPPRKVASARLALMGVGDTPPIAMR